jgi:hypothetical protein
VEPFHVLALARSWHSHAGRSLRAFYRFLFRAGSLLKHPVHGDDVRRYAPYAAFVRENGMDGAMVVGCGGIEASLDLMDPRPK